MIKNLALIHALTLTVLFYVDVITYPCPNPDADVGKKGPDDITIYGNFVSTILLLRHISNYMAYPTIYIHYNCINVLMTNSLMIISMPAMDWLQK